MLSHDQVIKDGGECHTMGIVGRFGPHGDGCPCEFTIEMLADMIRGSGKHKFPASQRQLLAISQQLFVKQQELAERIRKLERDRRIYR